MRSNRHDGTGYNHRLAQNYPNKVEKALLGALAEFAKQFPVILEEPPDHEIVKILSSRIPTLELTLSSPDH